METGHPHERFAHEWGGASELELSHFVETIPALFWRIHLVKNRIEFLNDHRLPELEQRSRELLQNRNFGQEIVLEQDLPHLNNFWQAVQSRKHKMEILRVQTLRGLRWLKFMGIPSPEDYNYYHGYVMDITEAVDQILRMHEGGQGVLAQLELFAEPVFLIESGTRRLYGANSAARELFALVEGERKDWQELLYGYEERDLAGIFEHLLFQQSWKGQLAFLDGKGREHRSPTSIRPLSAGGKDLLWVAIHEGSMPSEEVECPRKAQEQIPEKDEFLNRAREGDMVAMLRILLRNQPAGELADSALYSHISSAKDIVKVWGQGEPWKELEEGKIFPYDGTIAQNIDKFNLPYLIVEHTPESIKPIDWALFIPRGVLSYLAIPLYEEGILKTVLIFSSQKPRAFAQRHYPLYECLWEVFEEGLPLWKQAHPELQLP